MGWAEKSKYLLGPRQNDQAEVLEAFGLAAPIAEEDVVAFLTAAAFPEPTTLGEMKEWEKALCSETGLRAFSLGRGEYGPEGDVLWFPPDHRPLSLLLSTAHEIERDLHVSLWDAMLYLLADVPATVPWITIKWQGLGFGDAFSIHTGSEAVTGDEIAKAYNEVKYAEFGAREPRQVSLNEGAMYIHELECRRRGRTWEESWERWGPKAEELGANPYKYVEAYRNKVNDLGKRFKWIKDALDAEKRRTGRPRKTDEKGA